MKIDHAGIASGMLRAAPLPNLGLACCWPRPLSGHGSRARGYGPQAPPPPCLGSFWGVGIPIPGGYYRVETNISQKKNLLRLLFLHTTDISEKEAAVTN